MASSFDQTRYLEVALDGLSRAKTVPALFGEFNRIATELGFDWYTLFVVARDPRLSREPIFCSTLPEEFQTAYFARNAHLYDPYMDAVAHGVMPIDHRTILPVFARHPALKDVYEVGEDVKIRHGVTYPLPTVGVSRGVCFWSSGDEREFKQRVYHLGPMLRVIAANVAAAAETLGVFPAPADNDIRLTAREADCLRWLALGRTTAQTADILGVSERTVRFHVARAREKLGVETRSHAVSRALQLNLISL